MARIQPTLGPTTASGDRDMMVEAVFEGMALKKQVFGELDKVAKPGAILASNTSTLDVDEIAAATSRPHMVIGTHFFSPANVMRLARNRARESDLARKSSRPRWRSRRSWAKLACWWETAAASSAIACSAPIAAKRSSWWKRARRSEAVDQALYDFGMAMGPLATGDLAGLDVGWRIRKESGEICNTSVRAAADRGPLVRDGPLRPEDRRRLVQVRRKPPPIARSRRRQHDRAGPQRRRHRGASHSREEIVERTIYALVNEGRAHSRRRHRSAGRRHRHHLYQRLRLPGLSRRTDVVRRYGGP